MRSLSFHLPFLPLSIFSLSFPFLYFPLAILSSLSMYLFYLLLYTILLSFFPFKLPAFHVFSFFSFSFPLLPFSFTHSVLHSLSVHSPSTMALSFQSIKNVCQHVNFPLSYFLSCLFKFSSWQMLLVEQEVDPEPPFQSSPQVEAPPPLYPEILQ